MKRSIKITLDAAELADLTAIATAAAVTVEELAASFLRDTLGPRRLIPQKESTAISAATRMAIVKEWTDWRRGMRGAIRSTEDKFVRHVARKYGLTVGRATLYNWDARWRRGGVAGLEDSRASKTGRKAKCFEPFVNEAQLRMLDRAKPSVRGCYLEMIETAKSKGWEIPPLATFRRRLYAMPTNTAGVEGTPKSL